MVSFINSSRTYVPGTACSLFQVAFHSKGDLGDRALCNSKEHAKNDLPDLEQIDRAESLLLAPFTS